MGEKKSNPDLTKDSKSDQERARQEKIKKLAERGVELFPHKVHTTHSIEEIVSNYEEFSSEELEKKKMQVTVAGRITSIRKMGKASFFHMSNSWSKLQVYLKKDKVDKESFDIFSLLDIGDFVAVQGILFKTRTRELTVLAESLTFLAKALHPLPEKWHGLQDVELRYRQRYLDLIMNPQVAQVFKLRSQMIRSMRSFFDQRGYLEVETPMIQSIPGGALARPFKTYHNALGVDLYLRVAPELYLKRLVAGGFEKVYEINRNFRNEGISSEHNPEFTMLEFYQAFSDFHDMMELTEELINYLCQTLLNSEELIYGEHKISLKRPWKRIKFRQALLEYSGITPERLDNEKEIIELASGLAPEKKPFSYGKALDVIFDKQVKQKMIHPTFLTHHPVEVSPLAKASPENTQEVERFELVMGGMEVANGFSELTDPDEQRKRFQQQLGERKKGDRESHMIDEDYIEALEYGLPPTGGDGIGVDRLVMLFTNQKSIREVILFPLLRPK